MTVKGCLSLPNNGGIPDEPPIESPLLYCIGPRIDVVCLVATNRCLKVSRFHGSHKWPQRQPIALLRSGKRPDKCSVRTLNSDQHLHKVCYQHECIVKMSAKPQGFYMSRWLSQDIKRMIMSDNRGSIMANHHNVTMSLNLYYLR